MSTRPDLKPCAVQASTLYRLMPLLSSRDECCGHVGPRGAIWGWRIEPAPEGGVLAIATNGIAIGVIHDPQGRAHEPVTILASPGLRGAVCPPPPREIYYVGDHDFMELPDAFQPGTVYATAGGVYMTSRADDLEMVAARTDPAVAAAREASVARTSSAS